MSWWIKKYGKNSTCGITFSRLRPGKGKDGLSYSIFLPCSHGFYRKALLAWTVAGKNNCPICRRIFDPVLLIM